MRKYVLTEITQYIRILLFNKILINYINFTNNNRRCYGMTNIMSVIHNSVTIGNNVFIDAKCIILKE